MPSVPMSQPSDDKPAKTLTEVREELRVIHAAWVVSLGDHDGWKVGAAYLRESQKESLQHFSPAAQVKGILDEAQKRRVFIPWELVFMDARTGRLDSRTDFQELMRLARARKYQVLIMLHTSRFARNLVISRRYKTELRGQLGIEVVALNAQFDVSKPEGRFAEGMVELSDEYYSDNVAFWVHHGLMERFDQGLPLGSLPETFYLDRTSGELRPHPELSKVVREGALMYLTNEQPGTSVGFGTLAKWSDANDYRTPSGRRLDDEWWRNTLTNPKNAGYMAYRRKKRGGGAELTKGSWTGFLSLDEYQRIQVIRQKRTRATGEDRPEPTRKRLIDRVRSLLDE